VLTRTIYATFLLTLAFLCFSQASKPTQPNFDALKTFERDLEIAAARGDVATLERGFADDLVFTHGDAWRTGGKATRVDTKKSWLDVVRLHLFVSREVNSQAVEPHGSIAITTGRIDVKLKKPLSGRLTYSVWYERVYRVKGAGWELVSHRTVGEIDTTPKAH